MARHFALSSRLILSFAALGGMVVPAAISHADIRYTGVNLAGAEFGSAGAGAALPGAYGSQFTYPTTLEINYFVGKGMNTFRLPFRWERLQQSQNAAFDPAELARMKTFVNTATAAGAYIVIDPHNFARYYPNISNFDQMQSGSTGVIGSASVPITSFTDLWTRLANQFKSNNHVVFNLMNEPNAISTQTWVDAANAAIVGIRSTGATNLILVPGISWTGAHSWLSSGNSTAMLDIVDSGQNFAFDVHQYMDSFSSGGSDEIANNDPTIGVQRVTEFTNWLHTNDRRGFLGEFAVANTRVGDGATQIGDETADNLLDYMEANDDVWMGWTWWAGGPWWTSYMFSPEPTNLGSPNPTDKPLMPVLQPHFAHPVTGDFNGNGVVDTGDYNVWRDTLGQRGAGLAADGNLNGLIDDGDYNLWVAKYGHTTGPGAGAVGAVPEPGTLVLFALAGVCVGLVRRSWK